MVTENTLDHLLKIEAEAAALVSDAQAEADRRVSENEERNRAIYDETFKTQALKFEALLGSEKDALTNQYRQALDDFRKEISCINVNTKSFNLLLEEFLSHRGTEFTEVIK